MFYKTTVRISGISCQSCVAQIKNALGRLYGVKRVKVDFGKGYAITISTEELKDEEIIKIITFTGLYKVQNISREIIEKIPLFF